MTKKEKTAEVPAPTAKSPANSCLGEIRLQKGEHSLRRELAQHQYVKFYIDFLKLLELLLVNNTNRESCYQFQQEFVDEGGKN